MTHITQEEARKKLPEQMEIPTTATITHISLSDGTSFVVAPSEPKGASRD